MPKISVLMAIHNPNIDYLKECLDAIEAQTFKDFEVIIVNDCTTNCNLRLMLEGYNFTCKIIENRINIGLAKSLNRGLKECCGEYIARIDDDDIMYCNRLALQYDYAQKKDGFIFGTVDLIDENGHIFCEKSYSHKNIKKYLKKSGNCLTHSTLFVRKTLLVEVGGYDERFIYAQDYALYMKAIDRYNFYCIEDKIVKYRIPAVRTSRMKEILSILNCYGAAVNYFSSNKNISNYYYFIRRSLSLIKLLFKYIRA